MSAIRGTEPAGDYLIARLAGEIDLADAAELADELLDATPGAAAGLVIDLSDVHYIDSAGMRMLFDVVRRLEARRQSLSVAVPEESPIRSLLKIAAVHEAVPMHDTVLDCIAALRVERKNSG